MSSSESAFRFSGRFSVIVAAGPSHVSRRLRKAVSLAVDATIVLGYAIDAPVHLLPLTPLAFPERPAAVFPDAGALPDGDRRPTRAKLRERARAQGRT
jgi:hypothetical protein